MNEKAESYISRIKGQYISFPLTRSYAVAAQRAFSSGKKVNRGGLLLKEKAAARKLQLAEERLKAVEQRSGRALRAIGRKTGVPQTRIQQPLSLDSSSEVGI